MNQYELYLDLGTATVRLNFSNQYFSEHASNHLFLCRGANARTIGTINYIEDDTLPQLSHPSCKPNVVYIEKEPTDNGNEKVTLRIFDKYTIILYLTNDGVSVRYPSDAPVGLLLDDVLQAALHWVLEKIGGFILHGSCVVRNNTAIAIMGISGAGKSTTAFNLTRFGFHCYADDAVLVIPVDDALTVRPFTREISIRPLTFRLLLQQGVQISDYRKDGEKYFFNQTKEELSGARLKYLCFVEVSGESETTIDFLNDEQTLEILLREKKHFTFMARESAEVYSDILSKKVPVSFCAFVGTDLDKQGRAFESIVMENFSQSSKTFAPSKICDGRNHKREIIRKAWSEPGDEPLVEILPLLGDFDLKILKMAFSFFQTYPIGKIEPIESPSSTEEFQQCFEADWLRASDWIEGCKKLVEQSLPEVFRKFSFPWIKSAPLIYPFLSHLTSSYPEKHKYVNSAWSLYREESNRTVDNFNPINLHLLNFQDFSVRSSPEFQKWWDSIQTNENRTNCIYCWITQDKGIEPNEMLELLNVIGNEPRITVVPILKGKTNTMATSLALIRLAFENGFKPKISRYFPLCSVNETQVNFLLNSDAFELSATQGRIHNSGKENRVYSFIEDRCRIDDNFFRLEKPYSACLSCGFYPLGLCRGGFILKPDVNVNMFGVLSNYGRPLGRLQADR